MKKIIIAIRLLFVRKPVWLMFQKDGISNLAISEYNGNGHTVLLFTKMKHKHPTDHIIESNDFGKWKIADVGMIFYDKAGVDKFIKLLQKSKEKLAK